MDLRESVTVDGFGMQIDLLHCRYCGYRNGKYVGGWMETDRQPVSVNPWVLLSSYVSLGASELYVSSVLLRQVCMSSPESTPVPVSLHFMGSDTNNKAYILYPGMSWVST